jgi:hypothetical protein
MPTILTPKPTIDPNYKSGEVQLAEGWETDTGLHVQEVNASISEHSGGRLALILSKEDGKGGWTVITLAADATEKLRLALNRAYRERTRP